MPLSSQVEAQTLSSSKSYPLKSYNCKLIPSFPAILPQPRLLKKWSSSSKKWVAKLSPSKQTCLNQHPSSPFSSKLMSTSRRSTSWSPTPALNHSATFPKSPLRNSTASSPSILVVNCLSLNKPTNTSLPVDVSSCSRPSRPLQGPSRTMPSILAPKRRLKPLSALLRSTWATKRSGLTALLQGV